MTFCVQRSVPAPSFYYCVGVSELIKTLLDYFWTIFTPLFQGPIAPLVASSTPDNGPTQLLLQSSQTTPDRPASTPPRSPDRSLALLAPFQPDRPPSTPPPPPQIPKPGLTKPFQNSIITTLSLRSAPIFLIPEKQEKHFFLVLFSLLIPICY